MTIVTTSSTPIHRTAGVAGIFGGAHVSRRQLLLHFKFSITFLLLAHTKVCTVNGPRRHCCRPARRTAAQASSAADILRRNTMRRLAHGGTALRARSGGRQRTGERQAHFTSQNTTHDDPRLLGEKQQHQVVDRQPHLWVRFQRQQDGGHMPRCTMFCIKQLSRAQNLVRRLVGDPLELV